MTMEVEIIVGICNQYAMACIFNKFCLTLMQESLTHTMGGGLFEGGGLLEVLW